MEPPMQDAAMIAFGNRSAGSVAGETNHDGLPARASGAASVRQCPALARPGDASLFRYRRHESVRGFARCLAALVGRNRWSYEQP